jgi:hypothetical protein
MFQKGIRKKDFKSFILDLISKTDLKDMNVNSFIFFMDNALIHHSVIVKKLAKFIPIFYSCAYFFINQKKF